MRFRGETSRLSVRVSSNGNSAAPRAALTAFDDPIYLHQTFIRQGEDIRAFHDLGPALAQTNARRPALWRCHFHVPVFLSELENFQSTQADLIDLLQHHRQYPVSEHLEIETYTWNVLPERYRAEPVGDAIARELLWVREQLQT